MKPRRHQLLTAMAVSAGVTLSAGLVLFSLSSHSALSQPSRTIKIVVPFAPGGVNDVLARLLADQIGRTHGATTVVENRPGAGSLIGTEVVSRAAPDGNTLLVTAADLISPRQAKLNFDPVTSFEPICYLANAPLVIAVNASTPYRTLGNLLDAARAKPGDITLASAGPETVLQVAFEMLKHEAHVNMTFIPYAGGAPAVNALLGGHVTSALTSYTSMSEQLNAGKLRALATATRTRIAALPEVPTVAESGYNNYEVDYWLGLFAPANTPKETLSQLASWFRTALQVPEVKGKLVTLGLYAVGTCDATFSDLIHKQYELFGRIIREANVTAK